MKETKTISVILDKEFYEELKELAKKEERNFSWIVRKALKEYVDSRKAYKMEEE